jgi:hypothetical protein
MKEISEERISNLSTALHMVGYSVAEDEVEKILLIHDRVEERGMDFNLGDVKEIDEHILEKYYEVTEEEEEEEVSEEV